MKRLKSIYQSLTARAAPGTEEESSPRQQAASADPADGYPDRLNLGCGLDVRPGYLNIDLNTDHHPDIVADVRDLSMLPSGRFAELLANDVLEHLNRPCTMEVLAQWNRVLRLDGQLLLQVPSLLHLLEQFKDPENQTPERQQRLLRNLFGTQSYDGDYHYSSFTELLLKHYLQSTGFRMERLQLLDGWLYQVTAVKIRALAETDSLLFIADPRRFVDQAYRQLLRRAPDAGGRDFYLNCLEAGDMCRGAVLESLMESPEYSA